MSGFKKRNISDSRPNVSHFYGLKNSSIEAWGSQTTSIEALESQTQHKNNRFLVKAKFKLFFRQTSLHQNVKQYFWKYKWFTLHFGLHLNTAYDWLIVRHLDIQMASTHLSGQGHNNVVREIKQNTVSKIKSAERVGIVKCQNYRIL